jgi:hypothetical protein
LKNKAIFKKSSLESKLIKALPKMIDKVSFKIREDISAELEEIHSYISKLILIELNNKKSI